MKSRTRRVSTVIGLFMACLLAAVPNKVWAQEGLFFGELDALDLWRTMPNQLAAGPFTLGLSGTLGTAVQMGPHQDATGFFNGVLETHVDFRPCERLSLVVDSTLVGPVSFEQQENEFSPYDLTGQHQAHARFAMDMIDDTGFELTFDANVEHSNDRSVFARADVGPGAALDVTLESGLWVFHEGDALGWLLPFRHEWRSVSYLDGANPPSHVTNTISSGIGLGQVGEPLFLELLGVSWSQRSFDVAGAAPCYEAGPGVITACSDNTHLGNVPGAFYVAAPHAIDRLDFRFADASGTVTFFEDSHFTISPRFMLGATSMWDGHGREASIFNVSYGGSIRISDAQLTNSFGFGVLGSRHAQITADGEGFVAQHRIEFSFDYNNFLAGIGLGSQIRLDWLAHPEIEQYMADRYPDAIPTMSFYHEWFKRVWDIEVGTYVQNNYGTVDDFTGEFSDPNLRGWSHELGVFMRLVTF